MLKPILLVLPLLICLTSQQGEIEGLASPNAPTPISQTLTQPVKQFVTEEQIYNNVENPIPADQLAQSKGSIHPWVLKQLEQGRNGLQSLDQVFYFRIQPEENIEFKWAPIPNQLQQIIVNIGSITDKGHIDPIFNPEEDEYLQLAVVRPDGQKSHQLGKIYVGRRLNLQINTDYVYLTFQSTRITETLVAVEVTHQYRAIDKALKNQQFQASVKIMERVLESTQGLEVRREQSYKWNTGFTDRMVRHDSELLTFSILELLSVLVTATIQLYFIKSLLENRTIV